MKIGILSQWYDPEPGPASLPGVFAREFIAQGHEVGVLTGFPNYPTGRIYGGYRMQRCFRERRDGATVTRVALYPSHSGSAAGRVANYASFALSATASGRSSLRDVEAVWVYNSPVTVSLPLLRHTRGGKIPFFLHVQDLWPDSLIESGMLRSGWQRRSSSAVVDRIVRLTERRAAIIGVSSRGMKEIICQRHPEVDPQKMVYAPNPTNEDLYRPVGIIRDGLGISTEAVDTVELMYAGAVGDVQGLDALLDVAAMLRERKDIRISIVGDGISRDRLERRAMREGLNNVRFVGRIAQEAMPEMMARAHVQIVSLAEAPFLAYTTPSKISALLASGVPIIGHLSGDGARVVRESGAGAIVSPGDVAGLHAAIVEMVDGGPHLWHELGAAGRRYYENHLSVHSTAAIILRSLLSSVGNQQLKGVM